MKRKRVWRIVSVALIVVWAVVIFSFSAQPDTESSEISGHVSYRIVKMWNHVNIPGRNWNRWHRKLNILCAKLHI